MKCLESYLTIMNMIEKLISQIDMNRVNEKLGQAIDRTNETEKRFYFLENKVKVMGAILQDKIKKLQQEKERIL